MSKKLLKKELIVLCEKLETDNIKLVAKNKELESELNINKTWVEIGDQKLEKACKKIDELLVFKHKYINGKNVRRKKN